MKRTDMHNSLLGKTIANIVVSDDDQHVLSLEFTDGYRIGLAGNGSLAKVDSYWTVFAGTRVMLPLEDDA